MSDDNNNNHNNDTDRILESSSKKDDSNTNDENWVAPEDSGGDNANNNNNNNSSIEEMEEALHHLLLPTDTTTATTSDNKVELAVQQIELVNNTKDDDIVSGERSIDHNSNIKSSPSQEKLLLQDTSTAAATEPLLYAPDENDHDDDNSAAYYGMQDTTETHTNVRSRSSINSETYAIDNGSSTHPLHITSNNNNLETNKNNINVTTSDDTAINTNNVIKTTSLINQICYLDVDDDDSDNDRPIDIHAITDTILAAASCRAGTKTDRTGNCPLRLKRYLKERYNNNNIMIFHLSDTTPDVLTQDTFDRQILHIPWNSPGKNAYSETPSIAVLLNLCYTLSAWLSDPSNTILSSLSSIRSSKLSINSSSNNSNNNNNNIAIISCDNGKTRTAIAIACFLKYINIVNDVQSGFCHFLERRCSTRNPEDVITNLPYSLKTFFNNFDNAIELSTYYNTKPLLLKAISIQGVPVEDRPCLDIWDSTKQHIYSSHPHLWDDIQNNNNKEEQHRQQQQLTITSQWADEEGFYRINKIIQGDFCILCRFGGTYITTTTKKKQQNNNDTTRILFRYANNTGFIGSASPYELPRTRVDIQRRYSEYFHQDDFLLSLIFDAHWNITDTNNSNNEYDILMKDCSTDILPPILFGIDAIEAGWHEIVKYHVIQPMNDDIDRLITESMGELDGCPRHIVSLALQLANFDSTMSQTILLEGRLRSWWQQYQDESSTHYAADDDNEQQQFTVDEETILDSIEPMKQKLALEKISSILSSVQLSTQDRTDYTQQNERKSNDKVDYSSDNTTTTTTTIATRSSSSILYTSPIMRPHPGDVSSTLNATRISTLLRNDAATTFMGEHPLFPVVPRKKKRGNPTPFDDPANDHTVELLLRLDHPGVDLKDLLDLVCDSQNIGDKNNADRIEPLVQSNYSEEVQNGENVDKESFAEEKKACTEPVETSQSGKASTKHMPSGSAAAAAAAAAIAKRLGNVAKENMDAVAVNSDTNDNHVAEKGPADENTKDLTASEAAAALAGAFAQKSSTASENNQNAGPPIPMKEDPRFQKYFKMKKMGLPDGAIRNALQRDQVDENILDLDPDKSYEAQTNQDDKDIKENNDDVPLKDDPRFQKYFKMLQMGLPEGAVRNALLRDQVEDPILDLDPEKSLQSQLRSSGDGKDGIPLKNDPNYEKYFKMLKMGLPKGAVENAMQRDGVDVNILNMDPEKPLIDQMKSNPLAEINEPALKDDPKYEKYFKMLKMGLPEGAVRNAMTRDDVDHSVLDLDPDKSLNSQRSQRSQSSTDVDDGIPIKDDPDFQKYFKMLNMGLPKGAVRNAMERDGVDSTILDLDLNKSLRSQRGMPSEDDGVPLKDDPEWSKYFKMLKMGLPLGAVKNAVERDGRNPAILDLDHSKSIASQMRPGSKLSLAPKKKKRVRRKKIFWNPLNSKQIKADSLWSRVKGRLNMSQLDYDEKEFADLFTESADPADKKKQEGKKASQKVKKSVQVIDGKRSMNGGIILARLKMDYKIIAAKVDKMQADGFDTVTIKALKEMLPTQEEKSGLLNYMKNCGDSEDSKTKAYNEFSECEKYMYTMTEVVDAAAKFDCMLFRSQFKSRYDETVKSIEIMSKACDQVRHSEKLQEIMALILTLVNQINTGGDGNGAAGFTLDALLKLNEAKAFDKKTSVIQYLAKLVKRNDETLLTVRDDLPSLKQAELIVLDSVCSDIEALKAELDPIKQIVIAEAQRLEQSGQRVQMSIKELSEQRTSIRNIDQVPQYNRIDHHTGRTPMERFFLNAEARIQDATDLTDKLKDKYTKLLEYFGEDEGMASNEFFGTLNRFLDHFGKAIESVNREEKIRKREEEKLKANRSKESNGTRIERKPSGIAAMAAAAAGKKKEDGKQSSSGIAAMAAAASGKKKDEGKQSSSGIAAMAAAAAGKKKDEGKQSSSGIAAMAAAAAGKTKDRAAAEGGGEKKKEVGRSTSGIAAIAAAAAAKKQGRTSTPTSAAGNKEVLPSSGIAAAAAASTGKKSPREAAKVAATSGKTVQNADVSYTKDVRKISLNNGRHDAGAKSADSMIDLDKEKNGGNVTQSRLSIEKAIDHENPVSSSTKSVEETPFSPKYALPKRQATKQAEWIALVTTVVDEHRDSYSISESSTGSEFWVGPRKTTKRDRQADWLAAVNKAIEKYKGSGS